MRQRLDELGTGACFEAVERVLVQIAEKDRVVGQLMQAVKEIRGEVAKVTSGGSDDAQIEMAEKECSQKVAVYRQLLAEKAVLYDQLHASTKQLVHRDDIILKNEQDMVRLKYENDMGKLEVS